MVAELKRITVEPGSELDHLLDDASGPMLLVKGARTFLLGPAPDDIWKDYDPEASIRGIREAAGGWRGLVDADELKSYIRERRKTENRRQTVKW